MNHAFLASVLIAAQPAPQSAPPVAPIAPVPELSQDSRTALRCSAAFALVSFNQAAGDPAAARWPDVDERGREFFVRALARLMDETGIDREGAAELARREAQHLLEAQEVDKVMPSCLAMLDASGL